MVNIVGGEAHLRLIRCIRARGLLHSDEVLDHGDQIVLGEGTHGERQGNAQLLIELVPSNFRQIVAAAIKEH